MIFKSCTEATDVAFVMRRVPFAAAGNRPADTSTDVVHSWCRYAWHICQAPPSPQGGLSLLLPPHSRSRRHSLSQTRPRRRAAPPPPAARRGAGRRAPTYTRSTAIPRITARTRPRPHSHATSHDGFQAWNDRQVVHRSSVQRGAGPHLPSQLDLQDQTCTHWGEGSSGVFLREEGLEKACRSKHHY